MSAAPLVALLLCGTRAAQFQALRRGGIASVALLEPWTQQTLDLVQEELSRLDAAPPPGAPGGCDTDPEGGPAESDPAKGARIALLTQANGPLYETQELRAVVASQRCYAARHGYDFILYDGDVVERMGRGPREMWGKNNSYRYWGKWFAIVKYLPLYDWVMWIDADVLVHNAAYPFEAVVGQGEQDLVFKNGPLGLNNGVLAFKNSCWSRRFLRLWWEDGEVDAWYLPDTAWDNSAFVHAAWRAAKEDLEGTADEALCLDEPKLGWDCLRANGPVGANGQPFFQSDGRDPAPANVTRHLRAIATDPPGFNLQAIDMFQWRGPLREEDFLVHFSGPDKVVEIRGVLGNRTAATLEALLDGRC